MTFIISSSSNIKITVSFCYLLTLKILQLIKENSKKQKYLEVIYANDGLKVLKVVDDYVLEQCRKNILSKIENIKEDEPLLDKYLFPAVYNGVDGGNFKKQLQDFLISKILSFIDDKNSWPMQENFDKGEVGKIGYSKALGPKNNVGIFDGTTDLILKTLEYIDIYYSLESDETKVQQRKFYLTKIFTYCSPNLISTINNKKIVVDMILNSEEFSQIYIECHGEKALDKIKKITKCPYLFSQDNPQ